MRVVIKGYDIFHRTFSSRPNNLFVHLSGRSPHYETYKLNRFSDVRDYKPIIYINDKRIPVEHSMTLQDREKYIKKKNQKNLPSEIEKRNFERMIFSITIQMQIEQSDHSDSDSDSGLSAFDA
jgi:hypothetical protein